MFVSQATVTKPSRTPDRRPIVKYARLLCELLAQSQIPASEELRVLNLGCGEAYEHTAVLCAMKIEFQIPHVSVLGIDKDPEKIEVAKESNFHIPGFEAKSEVGDIRQLDQVVNGKYGLCIIRHPNIRANQDAWDKSLSSLHVFLEESAVVVVTTYLETEADTMRMLLDKHNYRIEVDRPNPHSIAFSNIPGASSCRYDNRVIVASSNKN